MLLHFSLAISLQRCNSTNSTHVGSFSARVVCCTIRKASSVPKMPPMAATIHNTLHDKCKVAFAILKYSRNGPVVVEKYPASSSERRCTLRALSSIYLPFNSSRVARKCSERLTITCSSVFKTPFIRQIQPPKMRTNTLKEANNNECNTVGTASLGRSHAKSKKDWGQNIKKNHLSSVGQEEAHFKAQSP